MIAHFSLSVRQYFCLSIPFVAFSTSSQKPANFKQTDHKTSIDIFLISSTELLQNFYSIYNKMKTFKYVEIWSTLFLQMDMEQIVKIRCQYSKASSEPINQFLLNLCKSRNRTCHSE